MSGKSIILMIKRSEKEAFMRTKNYTAQMT